MRPCYRTYTALMQKQMFGRTQITRDTQRVLKTVYKDGRPHYYGEHCLENGKPGKRDGRNVVITDSTSVELSVFAKHRRQGRTLHIHKYGVPTFHTYIDDQLENFTCEK